jgi:hypothetical protein
VERGLFDTLHDIERELRAIREEQRDQRELLEQILTKLTPPATRLVLILGVPEKQ